MKVKILSFLMFVSLQIMVRSYFLKGKPIAIRCGENSNGAIYIAHSVYEENFPGTSWYCQVYAS
jgi:hypothetical protein